MSISVKDQVVFVVGASSGIGRTTAMLFASEGARVMAAARREDRLTALREESKAKGLGLETFVGDVANSDQMERLAGETRQKLGRIDILVFAAGINIPNRAMTNLNVPTWDNMIEVNLNGAYYATRAVLPAMREAGSGHLIYVSSISGLLADASGAAYQAAKRGLLGLAHAIRFEEKENGIRTCVVCPGLVDTELVEKRPVKPTKEMLQKALQPEDVADMILAIAKLPSRAVVPEIQILPTVL
jgi:NADP-dependent 3-hydroxy acid dehydrogenase YdfG